MESTGPLTRKTFLGGVVMLPALAGLLTAHAQADASKSSQASMHYQNTPYDGKQCSGCTFFLPGDSATANGSCKLVDGTIAPTGYCIAFSAKSQ